MTEEKISEGDEKEGVRGKRRSIDPQRRQEFFKNMNSAHANLKANPEAWAEEQRERAVLDNAVGDGLKNI